MNKPNSSTSTEPNDFRVMRDVSYLTEDRSEKADFYLPPAIPDGKRVPAVVVIHGGGFRTLAKDNPREVNICGNLARNGYIAMSIDYALAAEGKPAWPRNLHDCKTAVRWLRANAERLQIDPDRIGVIGGSAGGTLASLVAMTLPSDGLDPVASHGDLSCAVRCAVDLYGVSDIAKWNEDTVLFNKTFAEAPELYRQASPITYVRPGGVPQLIIHGTADETVDVSQSEDFAQALDQAGSPNELILVPGAVHSFHLEPEQRDLRPAVLGFLDRHLKA